MSETPEKETKEPRPSMGGAAGPRVNVRKGIQGALLVAALIVVFTAPSTLDRRLFLFGAVVMVVILDLVMLARGDLEYTHFQNRTWSFRINAVLLLIGVVLFVLALSQGS